jgi:hypothetical protein
MQAGKLSRQLWTIKEIQRCMLLRSMQRILLHSSWFFIFRLFCMSVTNETGF